MRVLHIFDVHEELATLKAILEKYEPTVDHTVFHGDFLDSHMSGHSAMPGVKMMDWLKTAIYEPKRDFLFGNHDIQYAFNCPALFCGGFHETKYAEGKNILSPADWDKFKLFVMDGTGWLCSHAGIHEKMLHPVKGFDVDYLHREEKECFETLKQGRIHWMVGAGASRGGRFDKGGINWQDFKDDFVPTEGVRQLFGHTPGHEPRKCGNSWCGDCYVERTPCQYIAITIDGDADPEWIKVDHVDNNWPWESEATRYRPQRPMIPRSPFPI
jgi:hypothetical protein